MCRPVYSIHHPKSNSIVYDECNGKPQTDVVNKGNVRSYIDACNGKWKLKQFHDDARSDRVGLVYQLDYNRTKSRYASSIDTTNNSKSREEEKLLSPKLERIVEDVASAMDRRSNIPERSPRTNHSVCCNSKVLINDREEKSNNSSQSIISILKRMQDLRERRIQCVFQCYGIENSDEICDVCSLPTERSMSKSSGNSGRHVHFLEVVTFIEPHWSSNTKDEDMASTLWYNKTDFKRFHSHCQQIILSYRRQRRIAQQGRAISYHDSTKEDISGDENEEQIPSLSKNNDMLVDMEDCDMCGLERHIAIPSPMCTMQKIRRRQHLSWILQKQEDHNLSLANELIDTIFDTSLSTSPHTNTYYQNMQSDVNPKSCDDDLQYTFESTEAQFDDAEDRYRQELSCISQIFSLPCGKRAHRTALLLHFEITHF